MEAQHAPCAPSTCLRMQTCAHASKCINCNCKAGGALCLKQATGSLRAKLAMLGSYPRSTPPYMPQACAQLASQKPERGIANFEFTYEQHATVYSRNTTCTPRAPYCSVHHELPHPIAWQPQRMLHIAACVLLSQLLRAPAGSLLQLLRVVHSAAEGCCGLAMLLHTRSNNLCI